MTHIIERFLIHFVSSTFLTIAVFYALKYWLNHNSKVNIWLSTKKQHLLVVSALVVFTLAPLREPFDIYFGAQVWYKAITDQLSWFLGPAFSVWGLHRFLKEAK